MDRSIERNSEHPLAEAVVKYAQDQGVTLMDGQGFMAIEAGVLYPIFGWLLNPMIAGAAIIGFSFSCYKCSAAEKI